MSNEVIIMQQHIPFHEPNEKNEEWADDELIQSSNQTHY
jgi:hypothetical protein